MQRTRLTLPAFQVKKILLPGESFKLHVFEERYKELIKDCESNHASFIIPFNEENNGYKYGAEVQIINVIKDYPDGRKDLMIQCTNIVVVCDYIEQLSPKLYGAATIEPDEATPKITMIDLQDAIISYFDQIQNKMMDYNTLEKLDVYQVAVSLQLSPKEKMQLIQSKNKQITLLNLIKFITHIINAEQNLSSRFIFN